MGKPIVTRGLILYGNSSLDFRTNKNIIELAINFIISSKRFDGAFLS